MTLTEEVVAQTPWRHEIPVLKTERLVLRAPRLADVKAMPKSPMIGALRERNAYPHPYGVDDAEEFVASVNRRDGEACFVVICGGKPIGICSIDRREDDAEFGYWLGAASWGQGFATEARAPRSTMRSAISATRRCWPARGSAIQRRAGCWRSAASSGPACV